AGENISISWSGAAGTDFSYVQYRARKLNASTGAYETYKDYSSSTKLGTAKSGSAVISGSSSWADGTYMMDVRSVNTHNQTSSATSVKILLDHIAPVINSATISPATSEATYGNQAPKLTFSLTESHSRELQQSINGGAYTKIATVLSGSGMTLPGNFVQGKNTINLRVVDSSGNISAVKTLYYYYDAKEPEVKLSTNIAGEADVLSNNSTPTVSYTITDDTFKSASLKSAEKELLTDTTKSGQSVTLKEGDLVEGANDLTLTATDKAGNVTTKVLNYTLDTTLPTEGTMTVSPGSNKNNYRNALPTITWEGVSDENFEKLEVSVNNSTYEELSKETTGTAQLPIRLFTDTKTETGTPVSGVYTIKVRAIDKAGNASKGFVRDYYYEAKEPQLSEYKPLDVKVSEKTNGYTLLSFTNEKGKFTDDVEYEVYTGTTENFPLEGGSLTVKTTSNGSILIRPHYASHAWGTGYYYKIRAVSAKDNSKVSDCSDEVFSVSTTELEKNDKIGNRIYGVKEDFSTPNGNGHINMVSGNLFYEQTDLSVPTENIPLSINRMYNSKDEADGLFGKGWSSNLDSYLILYTVPYNALFRDMEGAEYGLNWKRGDQKVYSDHPDYELKEEVKTLDKKVFYYYDQPVNTVDKEADHVYEDYAIDTVANVKDSSGVTYYYDNAGRLVLAEDLNGTFNIYSYGACGRLEAVISNSGRKLRLLYKSGEDKNLVEKVVYSSTKEGEEQTISYEYKYDDNDYLKEAIFVGEDNKTIHYRYDYDENGRLSTIKDAVGNDYGISYSQKDRASKVTYPDDSFVSVTDKETTIARKYNSKGEELSKHWQVMDQKNRLAADIDALENETIYTYNDINEVSHVSDKNIYHELVDGKVVEKTASDSTRITYDKKGRQTQTTDSEGNVTLYTYDDTLDSDLAKLPITEITTNKKNETTSDTVSKY
ncbi:MAG: DUF6531 domain-containing protein, partial [Lachnospiraceae bacterium]|nr:DUF6531 domain-containing protein [Lachnospiraceae bacterium]